MAPKRMQFITLRSLKTDGNARRRSSHLQHHIFESKLERKGRQGDQIRKEYWRHVSLFHSPRSEREQCGLGEEHHLQQIHDRSCERAASTHGIGCAETNAVDMRASDTVPKTQNRQSSKIENLYFTDRERPITDNNHEQSDFLYPVEQLCGYSISLPPRSERFSSVSSLLSSLVYLSCVFQWTFVLKTDPSKRSFLFSLLTHTRSAKPVRR